MAVQSRSFPQGAELEREAARRLPGLLADLFDDPEVGRELLPEVIDSGVDAMLDARGRRWLFQLKSSSSPGVVATADDHFRRLSPGHGLAVLVVPFMTPAGARAAEDRGLNWIDLSGNAHLRDPDSDLHIWIEGRPSQFVRRGRPASAFASKSSRIARALLLDPERWWTQKELSQHTDLDPGQVSRVARRLTDDRLIVREEGHLRPGDPDLLLDAWSDEYRFDRHDIITGHLTGNGLELAQEIHDRLAEAGIDHAATGLASAWARNAFARFRLVSLYVAGDPRDAADAVELRRNDRGANVQLIGPDDAGVFDGREELLGLPCVSAVQTYLDLGHLPERAAEAAAELRGGGGLWRGAA